MTESRERHSSTSSNPNPSRLTDGDYVVLQEFNDQECEAWLYFIRRNGNEENLQHLQQQLEKIDWYVMDSLSAFDLDLEHNVSASTAKEMTKIELNAYSFHRKFDGKLQKIDFHFSRKDSNETKMCKVFDVLGYGQIENFIDDEDIDDEDMEFVNTDDEDSSSSSTDDEASSDDDENHENLNSTIPSNVRLPGSLVKK